MAPAHVSSRYHQSLRSQLICKGTVIPTDNAKLMVLFLSILGWSLLESLEPIRGAESINNLHKKGGPVGDAPATSSMPKSVLSHEKEKYQLWMAL